jgi:hypothetical protein
MGDDTPAALGALRVDTRAGTTSAGSRRRGRGDAADAEAAAVTFETAIIER